MADRPLPVACAGGAVPSEIKLGFITVKLDAGDEALGSEGVAGAQGGTRRASDAGPKRPAPLKTTGVTARRASAPHIAGGQPQEEDIAATTKEEGQRAKEAGARQEAKSAGERETAGSKSSSHPYQHAHKM
jgi:hypothetical protein